MAANPDEVPPAYRGRTAVPRSFIGLSDSEVLRAAEADLLAAQLLPVGAAERTAKWAEFDEAMGELARRAMRHTLGKIREHDEAHKGEPPDA